MKVKDGKVVLGKNDVRLGNFILHKEKEYYKACDVAGMWSYRVNMFSGMYSLIDECLKNKNTAYLETLIKMYYAISTVPADMQMLEDMYNAYTGLIERIRTANGNATEKEDKGALEDLKKTVEATETLQKVIDDGAQPDTQE